MQRPDLTGLAPDILAYIEMLEAEIESLRSEGDSEQRVDALLEPSEAPTSIHIITVSAGGVAKRTPRHLYLRQRRGGMGVFDLDTPENDPPAFVVMADVTASLILLTDQGRAFRLPVSEVTEREVRGRGLLIGIELKERVQPALVALLERGVLALPAGPNVLRLLPPLVIAEDDLWHVADVLADVLA